MDVVPVRVRGYIALVAAAAALFVVGVVAADRDAFGRPPLFLTSFLLVAGVVAQRYPVHLTEKTKVYVDAAIFTAAALALPPAVAMMVAATAVGINHVILRVVWAQALFNVAQTALYVGAGALTYQQLDPSAGPPVLAGPGSAVAVLAAAAVMHLLNTALVAGIVALQLDRSAFRTWRDGFALDLPQHVALVALGVLLAIVARDYPWLAPLFAAPLAFVYLSLRRSLQLRQATRSTLLAAADLVELARQGQAGHSRRVARHARQLGQRLGLEPDAIEDVEAAARLHHLGDLIGPAEVVAHGNEDGAEVGAPSDGPKRLRAFPAYARSATTIRHLTERWDGTGFPDRLAGEAIPLPARVLAVADAFDRLVSGAGSRSGADLEAALATLRAGAGRDWDPRVVEQMVAIVRESLAGGADRATAAGGPTLSREPVFVG